MYVCSHVLRTTCTSIVVRAYDTCICRSCARYVSCDVRVRVALHVCAVSSPSSLLWYGGDNTCVSVLYSYVCDARMQLASSSDLHAMCRTSVCAHNIKHSMCATLRANCDTCAMHIDRKHCLNRAVILLYGIVITLRVEQRSFT